MYTLYRHFFRAPPEVWGPGADSIQIGSAPAPGKKSNSRRLRLLTLKLVILARKLIINTILFYITFISINCSEFMFNTRTRLLFLKFFLPKRCSQSRKGGSGSRALTDQKSASAPPKKRRLRNTALYRSSFKVFLLAYLGSCEDDLSAHKNQQNNPEQITNYRTQNKFIINSNKNLTGQY